VNPKVIVILAGTNNLIAPAPKNDRADEVARGVEAIVDMCRKKAPKATIILTAIFPRNDKPELVPTINETNKKIARLADGSRVRFLNVNANLANANGKLLPGMMPDGLHPSVRGYQAWADGLKPILTEVLGPPAKTDHAPPPTGDPSQQR
jgi:lysophospholipase L1-like esterase